MAFTLQIGQAAPNFDLPAVDGKNYSLSSFMNAKILVVMFSCNHCPYVTGCEERIIKLYTDFKSRGVELVAINSNETMHHPDDSFEHMITHARDKKYPFPYLHDESQAIAKAYGALRTPHFFVFDAQRKLRYTGRLDDSPRHPGKETTHELRDALEALVAGRKPTVELTNPIGCNVKWLGKDAHWMPADACDLV
jgi:peroxiredoxin